MCVLFVLFHYNQEHTVNNVENRVAEVSGADLERRGTCMYMAPDLEDMGNTYILYLSVAF